MGLTVCQQCHVAWPAKPDGSPIDHEPCRVKEVVSVDSILGAESFVEPRSSEGGLLGSFHKPGEVAHPVERGSEEPEVAGSRPALPTFTDEEITRKLSEKSSAWDKSDTAVRREPTPAELDALEPKLDAGGGPKPGKPVPDWAFAFQVGQQLNINGFVCRVAGHYVDDVSEEAIGFVLIPEERTAAYIKRAKAAERNRQIDERRKSFKGVKGRKK